MTTICISRPELDAIIQEYVRNKHQMLPADIVYMENTRDFGLVRSNIDSVEVTVNEKVMCAAASVSPEFRK